MTVQYLLDNGYTYHHLACKRGYTRKCDIGCVAPYKGKFGEGYIRYAGQHCHAGSCKRSTMYTDIEYWIKKDGR